jgi:hypothetical protein
MYVYITTNLINNKKYIGVSITKNQIKSKTYLGSGIILKTAIKKYGKENFKKEIIKTFDNEISARDYEKFLISELNAIESIDYYNLVSGGYGGGVKKHPVSDETREKISKSLKGHKLSKEHIMSMSKPVLKYSLNGDFICEYKSKQELFRETNIKLSLNKKQNISVNGGYIFMFKNGDIKTKVSSIDDITSNYNSRISKTLSKLNYDDIDYLIKDKETGMTIRDLSEKYGICISAISELLSGKTYKWYWEKKNKNI